MSRSRPVAAFSIPWQATYARLIFATLLIVIVCVAPSMTAEDEEPSSETIAVGIAASSSPLWTSFVDSCVTVAPYCGVICFLAPLPTINQISRDKTIGNLPLLPYSSMVSNAFVWVMYGLLKDLPSVWASNSVGFLLGSYYFAIFLKHCGPMASNLPGTVDQHLKGAVTVIFFNFCLANSGLVNASDIIGKEGVFFCIILFASPLAALKHVISTKSAASIPLPFTVACFVNCFAWSVMGLWKVKDFNIYFPNLMGLSSAVAQLALKGVYGNRPAGGKESLST